MESSYPTGTPVMTAKMEGVAVDVDKVRRTIPETAAVNPCFTGLRSRTCSHVLDREASVVTIHFCSESRIGGTSFTSACQFQSFPTGTHHGASLRVRRGEYQKTRTRSLPTRRRNSGKRRMPS